MFRCSICGSEESREELWEEVFRIDGTYTLVDHIPVTVCARCGDETFSRATTEKIRLLVHGQKKTDQDDDSERFSSLSQNQTRQ